MTCPLFVELCAGTAAVSLRLHHPRARPPVSRMGAKTGYADVILRCLGLYPGQGAADGTRFGWFEPDPGVRLLLHAYRDRELALAAADIIRGWKDEEPRALWERLRAEGPAVCPPVDAREVARWRLLAGWAYRQGQPDSGFAESRTDSGTGAGHGDSAEMIADKFHSYDIPATIADDARAVDPREVARWVVVCKNARGDPWSSHGTGGPVGFDPTKTGPAGNRRPHTVDEMVGHIDTAPTLPATIADDARAVDPREVARWSWLLTRSVGNKGPHAGYMPGDSEDGSGRWVNTQSGTAAKWNAAPTLPATIADDARTVPTPARLPAGTVVYADVPYQGTTGYAHLFPREEWLPVVRRWRDAGALVCVSEAEPIPDLMAEGWHAVEITGERKGQKRTFGGTREWLTMSEPPRWRPSVQFTLFGAPVTHSTGRD